MLELWPFETFCTREMIASSFVQTPKTIYVCIFWQKSRGLKEWPCYTNSRSGGSVWLWHLILLFTSCLQQSVFLLMTVILSSLICQKNHNHNGGWSENCSLNCVCMVWGMRIWATFNEVKLNKFCHNKTTNCFECFLWACDVYAARYRKWKHI